MINEEYYDDPFPIQIASEDIQDCYIENKDGFSMDEFVSLIEGGDIYQLKEIYEKMLRFYLQVNFPVGIFGVVFDGYLFLEEALEDGNTKEVLNELEIDCTHLKGINNSEIEVLAIPFKNEDDMEYLGYVCRNREHIEYWVNGICVSDNQVADDEQGEF